MLTSLTLENYRGFQKYRIADLSRVNLLVGKNNCGKTSILEAIHLLASGGNPAVLMSIAYRRGEGVFRQEKPGPHRRDVFPDVSHLFHGHELYEDQRFWLEENGVLGRLTAHIITYKETDKKSGSFDETTEIPSFELLLEVTGDAAAEPRSVRLPVSEDGCFHANHSLYRFFTRVAAGKLGFAHVQFLTPESVKFDQLSEMWNNVLRDSREGEIIEAMRILEPRLADIVLLSGESADWAGNRAGIFAGFEGEKRRVPLGSHGDGMYRLFALALSLAQTAQGVLLIDEIDTGLHYSVMGDMWLLVVKAAMKSNVRVFATTHSFDCVRGLAWLCENHPELQAEVSLQKIERSLEEAVALDARQIMIAAEQGIEVR
ncbi:MAG: AAA family ATPase [Phycisphaerae bacterium]|nr:AAA family ATPase [Phycisphaerae bacterium]